VNISWQSADTSDLRTLTGIQTLLGKTHGRFLPFLFDPKVPKLRKRPGILLEDSWGFSHGEILLIKASLDLWSGSGHAPLWDLLETWDDATWIRFIQCLCFLKGFQRELLQALNSDYVYAPHLSDL
jgi:hypothetical protein